GCARRSARSAVAERIPAEERVEEITESERVARRRPTCRRACAVLTEEVVATPPLGIAQRLVREAHFLETCLGVGIVGIAVGVVAPRERAVRTLDLVVGRVARDAEHLVVIGHDNTRPSCSEIASTAASACR